MIILILELRTRLMNLVQKLQLVLVPLVRFLLAFVTFHAINGAIGHEPHLMKTVVELGLAAVGTVMPPVILVLMAALVSLAHVYVASPLLAILVAILMFILYCFVARFSGKYGYVVLLVPIAYILKIPYAVPLILGLIADPLVVIPMGCGVLIYRMFGVIKTAAEMEVSLGINDILAMYIDVIDRLLADKLVIVTIAVFSVMVIVMYLIRKLNIDYVFEIAVAAGTIVGILGFLFGDMYVHTQMDITSMVFGMVGSMVIALVFQFLRMALDYSAVERVQFEDDDYYYYVKAVPKIKLAVPKRRVKKISAAPSEPEDEPEQEEAYVSYAVSEEEEASEAQRYEMGEEIPEEEEYPEFGVDTEEDTQQE